MLDLFNQIFLTPWTFLGTLLIVSIISFTIIYSMAIFLSTMVKFAEKFKLNEYNVSIFTSDKETTGYDDLGEVDVDKDQKIKFWKSLKSTVDKAINLRKNGDNS